MLDRAAGTLGDFNIVWRNVWVAADTVMCDPVTLLNGQQLWFVHAVRPVWKRTGSWLFPKYWQLESLYVDVTIPYDTQMTTVLILDGFSSRDWYVSDVRSIEFTSPPPIDTTVGLNGFEALNERLRVAGTVPSGGVWARFVGRVSICGMPLRQREVVTLVPEPVGRSGR